MSVIVIKKFQDSNSERLELENFDVNEIKNFISNDLEKKPNIIFYLKNYDNKYNIDFSELKELNIPIAIKYGSNISEILDLESFENYRNQLLETKSKIINEKMSPYEKFLAAYQYAISFPFKFHSNMGSADNFISGKLGGKICEDYCSFIRELLCNEESIDLSIISFKTIINNCSISDHAELIVRIDDNKYNIHGIYVSDPTNDSYVEEWKNYFGDDFKPGEFFERSMMPISSQNVYKYADADFRIAYTFFCDDDNALNCLENNEEAAKLYLDMNQQNEIINMITSLANSDNANNFLLYEEVESVIKNQSEEKLRSYLNVNSIPFSSILNSLVNIMVYQGKTEEEITKSINRVTNNYNLIHNEEEISDRKAL